MIEKSEPTIGRRQLFAAGTAGAMMLTTTAPQTAEAAKVPLQQGATVLFQGDSITDAGRSRGDVGPNSPPGLGGGYAAMIAHGLLGAHPKLALRCFNRGISGNKVPQLAGRWEEDTLELQPEVLSILIGINDVWHKQVGAYHGSVEDYETGYTELLERTRTALPDIAIVICEPFVLRCGEVKDAWLPEIDAHRAAAKRVAKAAKAVWVPFQSAFDDVISGTTPPEYWAADGVHPTFAGHALMARTWLKATKLWR